MAFYSDDSFEPDRSVGYLARRMHQATQLALEPLFAEEGLTGIQWSALVSIWFGRGTTCAELARDLAHDKGAMTRLVDTLEERGWVTRVRDADDRRVINLALTKDGEARTLQCKLRVIGYWNALLADWDPAEAETLIALMQKLRATQDSALAEGLRA
jgi:DNA-binding MarR family transcriptional regulator